MWKNNNFQIKWHKSYLLSSNYSPSGLKKMWFSSPHIHPETQDPSILPLYSCLGPGICTWWVVDGLRLELECATSTHILLIRAQSYAPLTIRQARKCSLLWAQGEGERTCMWLELLKLNLLHRTHWIPFCHFSPPWIRLIPLTERHTFTGCQALIDDPVVSSTWLLFQFQMESVPLRAHTSVLYLSLSWETLQCSCILTRLQGHHRGPFRVWHLKNVSDTNIPAQLLTVPDWSMMSSLCAECLTPLSSWWVFLIFQNQI